MISRFHLCISHNISTNGMGFSGLAWTFEFVRRLNTTIMIGYDHDNFPLKKGRDSGFFVENIKSSEIYSIDENL